VIPLIEITDWRQRVPGTHRRSWFGQADALETAGQAPFDAVINAAVSLLRPVLLAAGTTVLGVIPLLSDVFWISLSVVIMFGLTLGAVITMVLLPTLYSLFFGIRNPLEVRESNPGI